MKLKLSKGLKENIEEMIEEKITENLRENIIINKIIKINQIEEELLKKKEDINLIEIEIEILNIIDLILNKKFLTEINKTIKWKKIISIHSNSNI